MSDGTCVLCGNEGFLKVRIYTWCAKDGKWREQRAVDTENFEAKTRA